MADTRKNAFGDPIEAATTNSFGDPIESPSVNITPGTEKLGGTPPPIAAPPSPAGLAGPKLTYMDRVMTNLPASLARMSPLNIPLGQGPQWHEGPDGKMHMAPIGSPMDLVRGAGKFINDPVGVAKEAFAEDPAGTVTAVTSGMQVARDIPGAARAVARGGRAFTGPIPESTDPLERSNSAWESNQSKKAAAASGVTPGEVASSAVGVVSPRWKHALDLAGSAGSKLGEVNLPTRLKLAKDAMMTPEPPPVAPIPVTSGPQPAGQAFVGQPPVRFKSPPVTTGPYRNPSGIPVSGPSVPGYTPPPEPAPRGAPGWQSLPVPVQVQPENLPNIQPDYPMTPRGAVFGPLPNRGGTNALPRDAGFQENTPKPQLPPKPVLEAQPAEVPPQVTPQRLSAAPVRVPGAVAQTVSTPGPEPITAAKLSGESPHYTELGNKGADIMKSNALVKDENIARWALTHDLLPEDLEKMTDQDFAVLQRSIPTGKIANTGRSTKYSPRADDPEFASRRQAAADMMRRVISEGGPSTGFTQ